MGKLKKLTIVAAKKLTVVTMVIVSASMIIGFSAKYIFKVNDSPVVQAAEVVLKAHGIDIDFSQEDKNDLDFVPDYMETLDTSKPYCDHTE